MSRSQHQTAWAFANNCTLMLLWLQYEGWWIYELCYKGQLRQFHLHDKKVSSSHELAEIKFVWRYTSRYSLESDMMYKGFKDGESRFKTSCSSRDALKYSH